MCLHIKLKEDLTPKQIAELGESFEVTVVHEATPIVYDEGKLVLFVSMKSFDEYFYGEKKSLGYHCPFY